MRPYLNPRKPEIGSGGEVRERLLEENNERMKDGHFIQLVLFLFAKDTFFFSCLSSDPEHEFFFLDLSAVHSDKPVLLGEINK